MAHRRAPKWAKRRGTPRWARLLSWMVAAVIWLWVVYVTIVRDLPETSVLANAGADLLLNGLLFVVAATALAGAAMFLVRLIGLALR